MKKIVIKKPIFIIGVQRSGTTILDNLFTRHKDTAFFENFSSRYYKSPWKFKFIPLMIRLQKIKRGSNFRPVSAEGRVWNRFFSEIDYLDETKVTDEIKNYYYSVIKAELQAFNAKRFVNKNPAHCLRIRWINEIFPDAHYIIISRESKSVISSIYRKMLNQWDTDPHAGYDHKYRGYHTVKEKFGKNVSKLQACINYYNYIENTFRKDLHIIKNNSIKIQYEEFVRNPQEEIKKLYEFTELKWYKELENIIPDKLEEENNDKWKTLEDEEISLLTKSFD